MKEQDNLLGLIQTLFRWKKTIIYTTLLAAIGTVIISLLLSNYYEASTVFLAASPDVAKPEQLFGESNKDMEYYGNDNDHDRLLTIAESYELVNFLVDSFQLYQHYDIDSTQQLAEHKIRTKFAKLYTVSRTKRDAIILQIEDKDPVLAAKMANAAREKIGQMANELIKKSQQDVMMTFDHTLSKKEIELQLLTDSVQKVRQRYGVYNPTTQSESLIGTLDQQESKLVREEVKFNLLQGNKTVKRDTIVIMKANVEGLKQEVSVLREKAALFNEGVAKLEVLHRQHQEANLELSKDKERYKRFQAAYNADISSIILVEAAEVPVYKSRPKRSIIVIAATLIAFILSVLAVLLMDLYKEVNWSQIIHDS